MATDHKEARGARSELSASWPIVAVLVLFPLIANAIIAPEYPCGDCDRSGSVTIPELQFCANIENGTQPLSTCPACDVDGDGEVTEEEVQSIISPGPGLDCPPVIIDVGSAGRDGSGKATIPVTLSSGRFSVGGTQNDLLFDNTILSLPSIARCRINPAIDAQDVECQNDPNEVTAPCKDLLGNLDECGGDPQPDGCPDDAGSNITRLRALVTSFSVPLFNPIPNGLLYECEFDVIDPNALPAALTSTETVVSRPRGGMIFDVIGSDGEVTADAPPTPVGPTETASPQPPSATPTLSRTPTVTQTGTPPATPAGFQIIVHSAAPDGAGEAVVHVNLESGSALVVGGMQNDIVFDNTIVALAGPNSCRINPEIGTSPEECEDDPENITLPCKTMTRNIRQCGTIPQPSGCPAGAGDNLSRFRAIIASTAVPTTNPLPRGLLYTCTFQVLDAERLPAALIAGNPVVSSPFGMRLFPVAAISGAIVEPNATPPPPFLTHSVTPSASSTATPSVTRTPTVTSTPSSTSTLTPTSTASLTPSQTPTATPIDSPTPTATASPVPCDGDCDGSESVTVDEITRLVTLALGGGAISECTAGDIDSSETITVDELVTAVTRALNGCPDASSPIVCTPTPSPQGPCPTCTPLTCNGGSTFDCCLFACVTPTPPRQCVDQ